MAFTNLVRKLKSRSTQPQTRGRRLLARVFRPYLERLEDRTVPTTFTVLTTLDSGAGSLRQAILDANNTANVGGPDIIAFNLPTTDPGYLSAADRYDMAPTTEWPTVTDPVVIDGTTQAGLVGVSGIRITSGSSTLRGLYLGDIYLEAVPNAYTCIVCQPHDSGQKRLVFSHAPGSTCVFWNSL